MKAKTQSLIGIVIPVFNEAEGIAHFHKSLSSQLENVNVVFRIFYVNDGSKDDSADIIRAFKPSKNTTYELIDLSRNFGKEAAVSAGIKYAYDSGADAVVILDADGQHPVDRIADFIAEWKKGAEIVVGVRANSKHESIIKRLGSKVFYASFNKLAGIELVPRSTDFRLIDRQVSEEFIQLTERSRMTRGLIDWLGFKKSYLTFEALDREYGSATYSTRKLFQLAINSFISLSMLPLYVSGYLGIIFMCVAFVVGVFIFIEQFILGDPLGFGFSGPTIIGVVIIFLVGIILSSIGLLALYIAKILEEAQNRPLYIVRKNH